LNQQRLPIWKRASIGTEPLIDLDGVPKVMIDTATREGMSGSLVLARHDLSGPYTKKDGTTVQSFRTRLDQVLGVYSGRIGEKDIKAQLGIVWKARVINEIIEGKKPGWS
jgi:hypothetical protein